MAVNGEIIKMAWHHFACRSCYGPKLFTLFPDHAISNQRYHRDCGSNVTFTLNGRFYVGKLQRQQKIKPFIVWWVCTITLMIFIYYWPF